VGRKEIAIMEATFSIVHVLVLVAIACSAHVLCSR